jgi:GTP diphosphokinase / guanosine-3',5'-bis(diphosphate) 3'-diphosphatase
MQSRKLNVIVKAMDFAAWKHRNQRRKDAHASPYINHPIALANLLCNEAGIHDPVVICAALLHDTIEDTETTPEELEQAFGKAIASVVMEVTDDKNLPKAERKRLQIVNAPTASRRARLVKLADKICNLRDIVSNPPPAWNLRRKRQYFDWAGKVIDGARGTHRRLERLFDAAFAGRP